ncbi:MAG: protein kinase, partial [Planctomycetota bacterium]
MAADAQLKSIDESKHYNLVRLLAEGGMGAVYEAEQFGAEGFKKTVAIKTILESFSTNTEFVRLFIGEAKLVADLVHENIVQVYHLGKAGNIYYIALEFVDGINAENFIDVHLERGIPLPLELGAFIISRVCRGLEYAHNKRGRDGQHLNIVHRDVSPKNIMINYEGVVKLTDFGIAKARMVMEQEEGEVLMGKVEYMSPEQARYEATDRRSDIFCLGIVMYELLTGFHIFETGDIYETLENVKSAPIPDPRKYRPEMSDGLCEILMRALERDLQKRYQTAGEMSVALEYYMYHGGYGPTNVTLGNYIRKHFRSETPEADDGQRLRNPQIQHRADTPKIDALLARLQELTVSNFVPDGAPELDASLLQGPTPSPVLELTFLRDDSKTNIALDLKMGASPTNNPKLAYARRLSPANVIEIARDPLLPWEGSYTNFLDYHLTSLSPALIDSIQVAAGEKFTVQKTANGSWVVTGAETFPADALLMQGWLSALT